jgi:uncharacterized metal-binding protein
MTVQCAKCTGYICRGGNRDAAPDDCPMRGDFPAFAELYPEDELRNLLVQSSLVERAGYCRWTRLREVAEFALRMEYRQIGVAHSPDMVQEATQVATGLGRFGLEPILPPAPSPPLLDCEPRGQAEFFAREGAKMIVLAGMSVGHEAILVRASQLPVVALVARDTRLLHNPAAALYTSRGYLKEELFGHWPTKARPPFQGWDMEELNRVAREAEQEVREPHTRLWEAMELAHKLGVTHIGVTFCVGFREEAKTLTNVLETNGFRVSSVCCKTGSVPKEEAGITDQEKVRPGRPEMICNPAAQADLLNRERVELALVLGQCVGHDAATFQRLDAPAACLVAKDRVLAHNTVAGLR